MLGYVKRWTAMLTIAAWSAALVSCGSINEQSAASEPTDFATHAHNLATPTPESQNLVAVSSPGIPTQTESPKATPESDSGVGVSNARAPEPAPSDGDDAALETPFDSGHPMLHGIGFQDNVASVEQRFGSADSTYDLPGENATIDMREYAGFAVGFDKDGNVVYVELNSSEVPTGISGLKLGMTGDKAAELLEILDHPDSHVLTMNLAEGWLKLDLDPDTHEVLSIKLIGS